MSGQNAVNIPVPNKSDSFNKPAASAFVEGFSAALLAILNTVL